MSRFGFNNVAFAILAGQFLLVQPLMAQSNDTASDLSFPIETYQFIGVGLSSPDSLVAPKHADFSSDVALDFSIGTGWSQRINSQWLWQNELSVDYSQANLSDKWVNHQLLSGKVENIGIWNSVRIIREDIVENVSPFAEIGVGVIHAQYDLNNHSQSDWVTGYEAKLGLQFDISDKVDLAIAVGFSDNNDLNVPYTNQPRPGQ